MRGLQIALGFLATLGGVGAFITGVDALGGRSPAPPSIVMVTNGSSDYWQRVSAGARAGARESGARLRLCTIEPDGDAEEQAAILDGLGTSPPDGVAVCPLGASATFDAVDRLAERTKVLTYREDAANSRRLFYLTSANFSAGRRAASEILDALPHGGRLLVLMPLTTSPADSYRLDGVREAVRLRNAPSLLAGEPARWAVIEVRGDAGDASVAKQVRDALGSLEDCGIVHLNGDPSAIIRLLAETGSRSSVRLIAFDGSPQTFAAIERGELYATLAEDPYELGRAAASWLARLSTSSVNGLPARGQGLSYVRPILYRQGDVPR